MRIKDVTAALEAWAPTSLQENYDNCGLQVGDPGTEITAALVCLDVTEAVVEEAVAKGCGLIISHHPLIFKGLKSLVARGYVERTLLLALEHGIALYAIHTNLDNVIDGVNGEIATRLGLQGVRVLEPRPGQLAKMIVFVPSDHAEVVRNAAFKAGAGRIGHYDECGFTTQGIGSFKPDAEADPFVGRSGVREELAESKLEFLVPAPATQKVLEAVRAAHPYEEVAYDLIPLLNEHPWVGSGLIGELGAPRDEKELLNDLKTTFGLQVIRHTRLLGKPVERIAVCGGSGVFLLNRAKALQADVFITGDVKYHDFFEADGRLLLADIGHYGSEQFTMHLIQRRLGELFPTFAVRLTETVTDPIHHF